MCTWIPLYINNSPLSGLLACRSNSSSLSFLIHSSLSWKEPGTALICATRRAFAEGEYWCCVLIHKQWCRMKEYDYRAVDHKRCTWNAAWRCLCVSLTSFLLLHHTGDDTQRWATPCMFSCHKRLGIFGSLGYICSNSQKYITWVKIIAISFMPKIIRTLSKDQVPLIYFVNVLL